MENYKKTILLYQAVMILAVFPALVISIIGWKFASDVIPAFVYLITGLAVCGVPAAGIILSASRMIAGKDLGLTCCILQIVYGGLLAGFAILTIVGICI